MGNIPKEEIKERALERYKKSGRFVPMFVIEDFYANGEKNLKELKSMVDGYIVVDGSSYDYKIIEQGGKKLPNKRLYEKLGEKIKLKTGGGVDKKKKTDFTISEYIQLEKQKLKEHNAKAHEDDRLDWADWKSELTKEDTKEYGIYYNSRMLDSNGDRGVFEYLPTNKNYSEDEYAKGGGVDDIKSIAKQLKFPPATRSSSDSIMWNKKGGHAGDKVVYRVMENAEKLGWTRTFKQSTHPAYDIVSNQNVLFDPTGKYKIKGYQRYGNTSYDNWYQLDLTAVINTDDQEAKDEINSFKEKMKSYKKGGPTKAQSKKVGKVMHEFKEGTLHSGKSDKVVKNPKQAIAIALSEGKRGWKHKNKS